MAELTQDPVASEPSSPAELDELTLRRAQRGEDDACRQLVLRYQGPVFALVSRTLPGTLGHQVEDIAQDTFLQVFRALPRFDPTGPARLSTWILTIASRRTVDVLRRTPPVHESLQDDAAASSERADRRAREARMAAAVERALAELPPEYRVAFVLRSFHDLDYREIASALDVEVGTVKSRLSRARARLAELLAEELR